MGRLDHPAQGADADPYKIVTIASGFAGATCRYSSCCRWSRAAGSSLLAFLLHRYGPQARVIIGFNGFWVTTGAIVLVASIVAAVYVFWLVAGGGHRWIYQHVA
jgi:hypothetical protein